MKKRSKVMIIILALIVLYVIGGAVMLLKSGRPGGGDLSAYMERKYNKEFEIIEEFTYIAYTDGEPETYKTFLEGLEQARGEDDEISEKFTGDKLSTDIGIEEEINFEEDLLWYMELWAEYLEPIMTKDKLEELDDIEWDEKIRPYMEYDWIDDEHIDRTMASVNSWHMQLADINLDGQPEMLVSEYFQDMKEELTHIFTIQDGEVVYCGKIIASEAYKDNELFGGSDYLPSYYVDVYQNESGEFRYLSCEDWCYSSGYYQIYVSTFDGRSISDKPVFAIGYTYDEQGKMIYSYATGDWLERDNEVADDEHCAAFERMIEEYMEGYEKADIDFTVSQYRVPAFAGELPKEQQAIARKNIVAGFAQALGYMKEE